MLMQSALSCDSRKFLAQPYYRGLSPTPPPSSDSLSGSLMGVSRKLQTLLNVSPGPSSTPLPPRSMRLASPFHLEINQPTKTNARSRKPASSSATPKPSIPKTRPRTPSTPPRTRSKRSRSVYENDQSEMRNGYATPKRRRRLPYHIPLGLGIADFEALDEYTCTSPMCIPQQQQQQQIHVDSDPQMEALRQIVLPSIEVEDTDKADWTAEEDEKLVDMVLEKFKLSKRDWEECARRIGKDNASVGRRWQALLGEGNIGLRRGSGPFIRGRLDGCFDEQP
ncbi:hypothetical protein UA08_00263 [Talaromyces atroroseus]|uniref:Myb-like domain-containing protein n=1 Tax=Talaromyces atroroseus TaxID=1441469 RepID=A0A225B9K7_TALAT|nr:hypothetical protein UA08_00263 [Talaromyces atroroseus]OKL63635.1 hypothetical protein UA08_00263 [Talaromyces atroroseus]